MGAGRWLVAASFDGRVRGAVTSLTVIGRSNNVLDIAVRVESMGRDRRVRGRGVPFQ
jgi:hypothetical protein